MAGAGYKLFNTGDVLTAAQVNTYLMEQTVMVFANAAARTTALSGVVSEGMISYLKDTNAVEVYDGSNWVSSDDPNAIQNTIVDAKGDLIAATAADTPARLAVGNNGETLIADSTASTGLKWAKSPNFVGVSLANSVSQTIANNTNTLLTWNTENIDTDGFHSTVSNTDRITIPTGLGGKYLVSVQMRFHVNATGDRFGAILLNGGTATYDVVQYIPSSTQYIIAARSLIISLNAGDYISFRVFQTSGGNLEHYARPTIEVEGFSAQYLGA